jgi:hypothetical protein
MQQQELRHIGSSSFTIEDPEFFYAGGSVLMAVIVLLPYLRRNREFRQLLQEVHEMGLVGKGDLSSR